MGQLAGDISVGGLAIGQDNRDGRQWRRFRFRFRCNRLRGRFDAHDRGFIDGYLDRLLDRRR
jgi:hypothetical protein